MPVQLNGTGALRFPYRSQGSASTLVWPLAYLFLGKNKDEQIEVHGCVHPSHLPSLPSSFLTSFLSPFFLVSLPYSLFSPFYSQVVVKI